MTWIPTAERLPENGQRVIYCGWMTKAMPRSGTYVNGIHPGGYFGVYRGMVEGVWKVTHWMPWPELPTPPEDA